MYTEIWEYLDERGVSLMPTVYGLESRNPESPAEGIEVVPGPYRGEQGDFALSEGLSVVKKEFITCHDSGSTTDWLKPVPEPGYPPASPCTVFMDPLDPGPTATPVPVFSTDFNILPTFTLLNTCRTGSWDICDEEHGAGATRCWTNTNSDAFGAALSPSTVCTDNTGGDQPPTLFVNASVDPDTRGRLYAIGFSACIPATGTSAPLEATLMHYDAGGVVQARYSDIELMTTDPGSAQWRRDTADPDLYPSDTGNTDCDWAQYSMLFRVPDDASLASVGLRVWSSTEYADTLLLDDFEIVEVDGALRNMDDGTVDYSTFGPPELDQKNTFRVFAANGEELDEDCFDIVSNVPVARAAGTERGWTPYFDTYSAEVTGYHGSIQVLNTACLDALGGNHDLTVEEVYVSYRTWTHAGFWPIANGGSQDIYSWSPDVYEQRWWDHVFGPEAQLSAIDVLGLSGNEDFDEFVLVSGGEIRGINRAEDHEATAASDKLGSLICGFEDAICHGLEGTACTSSYGPEGCANMFEDPLDPTSSFSACTCMGWTPTPPAATDSSFPAKCSLLGTSAAMSTTRRRTQDSPTVSRTPSPCSRRTP